MRFPEDSHGAGWSASAASGQPPASVEVGAASEHEKTHEGHDGNSGGRMVMEAIKEASHPAEEAEGEHQTTPPPA